MRHPLKYAIYGLALVGLLGGAAAWASLDKTVTLSVDGDARSMHTYASTVHGVLDDAKLTVATHDLLAPGADARVKDGMEIVLRRGRLLTLTVDGLTRRVWVTAASVQDALDQIGYRQTGLYLSANRSKRLPLDGFSLTIRTPKTVTIVADHHTQRLVTTVPTVGDLMNTVGVAIGTNDRVSALAGAPVVNGMTITVTRVRFGQQITRTVISYQVIEKQDPTLEVGTQNVTTAGVTGLQQVTYLVTYLDGRAASRKVVASKVVTAPVDQVVAVGTKPVPPPPPAATTTASSGPPPSTGGLNWAGLAQCESGGNPRAVDPSGTYFGLYQFDVGTWQSNGGSGNPADASPGTQTQIADRLYQARGRAPWPVCGRYL